MVRVSVGLPFFNDESTLPDAIRSIYAQEFSDWELLLLDDGSSDRSLAIAQAAAAHDDRVKVYSDGNNRGLANRLNQIAQLAQGEYLARMDADDLMHPNRLQLQLEFLDAHPDIDLVSSAIYTIDEVNDVHGIRLDTELDTRPEVILRKGLLIHPTVTGRTVWFQRNSYDESFSRSQDLELWCRTCQHSRFSNIQTPLLFYREYASVSLRKYWYATRSRNRIFRMYGPAFVGRYRTTLVIVEAYLKFCTYVIFSALGRKSVLIKNRSLALAEKECAEAVAIISAILQTPLNTSE